MKDKHQMILCDGYKDNSSVAYVEWKGQGSLTHVSLLGEPSHTHPW